MTDNTKPDTRFHIGDDGLPDGVTNFDQVRADAWELFQDILDATQDPNKVAAHLNAAEKKVGTVQWSATASHVIALIMHFGFDPLVRKLNDMGQSPSQIVDVIDANVKAAAFDYMRRDVTDREAQR